MRRGLTFRARVTSIVLAAVIIGGFGLLSFAVADLRTVTSADTRTERVIATANALEKSVIDIETGLRGFEITGEERFLDPFMDALGTYPGQARALDTLTLGDPYAHRQAVAIGAAIDDYVNNWAAPVLGLARVNRAAARAATASGGGLRKVDAIRTRFEALDRHEQAVAAARRSEAKRTGTLALSFGLGAAVLSTLLIVAVAVAMRRSVVVPVNRLAAAATRVRGGDLAARVPERGLAEVGELAAGFNAMAQELQQRRDEIEHRKTTLERQQTELKRALSTVERQKARAETLQRFGERLAAATQVQAVAEVTLRDMADHAHAEAGAVYVLNEETGACTLYAARGITPGGSAMAVLPGQGLAGRALAERRPIAVTHPETSLRLEGMTTGYLVRHELHLPLLHHEAAIGVISLGRTHDEPFTVSGVADLADLAVLADLAERASVACAEALGRRRVEVLAAELQALMDSTDEGIFRIGLDCHITFANRAGLALTGYTEAELLGRNANDMLGGGGEARGGEGKCPLLAAAAEGTGRLLSEEMCVRKDGTSFPVQASVNPLLDGGEPTGAVLTMLDISARKTAERQLTAQYKTARVLADAASVEDALPQVLRQVCDELGWQIGLAWAASGGGGHLACTASYARRGHEKLAAQLAGEPVEMGRDVAGKAWTRREPVVGHSLGGIGMSTARPDGPSMHADLAVPVISGTNVIAVLEFLAQSGTSAHGLLEAVETVASQVAQYAYRKETEEATTRMKEQFVATVSHELRTPLTAIDGWLHILLGGEPGPLTAEQRRFLTTINRNSDRLMRLVEDLLLVSQIDAGKLALEPTEVDLSALARETTDMFTVAAAGKGIDLTVETAPATLLRGDKFRLGQLLTNLLSNAVKFTPEGGQVSVRVSHRDGSCVLEVADTGLGIPPGEREHLFERFYRTPAARQQGITGSGLGLAISKAIAEAHNGAIRATDADGRGTTFVVELPLAAHEEAST